MKTPDMAKENNFVLREAAKAAQMGYFDHLSAGGKCDPAEERWIEALTAGADAITKVAVLESRLAQVEKELKFKEKCLEWRYRDIAKGEDMLDEYAAKLAQVERERDVAVADFTQYVNYGERECNLCRHNEEVCLDCTWEWRGVKSNEDRRNQASNK